MLSRKPVYKEIGSCIQCGYGVVEFTDEHDNVPKYTHGRNTPMEERHHEPVLDDD